MRQIELQRLPRRAVVVRNVEAVFRARVEQARHLRVFAHNTHVAEHRLGNAAAQRLPRLAVIGRLINVRVAVVDLMAVNRNVGRAARVPRGFNVVDRTPFQKARHVGRQIFLPRLAAVAREADDAVIRADPEHAFFLRRFGH